MSGEDETRPGAVWLVREGDFQEPAELDVAAGSAAGLSRVGPEPGRKNEDAAAIVAAGRRSALLAVADGFGGAPSGERASGLAVSELADAALSDRTRTPSLRAAVLDGFEAANRGILELGIGAATTLAAVTIEDGLARPFHSGDSSILIVGGRGKIKWQTVAHSPAGYAVASGWMAEDEAREHDEAQVVSNYLGSPEMRIEIGPEIRLKQRDVVLLASDGLTDNVPVDEVAQVLAREATLAEAIAELARRAASTMQTSAGKPDDCTLVAFRRGGASREV